MPDMTPEGLGAVEDAVHRAVREAITRHEEERHLPPGVQEFLRANQRAIEWLVDIVRGPQIVDPITGVVQDQRDVEQGLAERVRRIEEQTSAIPAITKAVNRMEATLQNGGVRAKLSLRDVAKVAFYVGVVLAAVVEGLRFVSGL